MLNMVVLKLVKLEVRLGRYVLRTVGSNNGILDGVANTSLSGRYSGIQTTLPVAPAPGQEAPSTPKDRSERRIANTLSFIVPSPIFEHHPAATVPPSRPRPYCHSILPVD